MNKNDSAMQQCPVCFNDKWKKFLTVKTKYVMRGDGSVIPGGIDKISCVKCGAVRNKTVPTKKQISKLYSNLYCSKNGRDAEHLFFVKNKPIPRSAHIFGWILPHLTTAKHLKVLEIGSGTGLLLKRIRDFRPEYTVIGFEANAKLARMAQKRYGLNIIRKLVTNADPLGKFDVIISIAVLEHVVDIRAFTAALSKSLNPGGKVILALPLSDKPNYDIYFADHFWTLRLRHVVKLLNNGGFKTLSHKTDPLTNFGIFTAKLAAEKRILKTEYCPIDASFWKNTFAGVDRVLEKVKNGKIAVFGAGEIFALLWTYTKLKNMKIIACIDENPSKHGKKALNIPIKSLKWLVDSPVKKVVLAVNRRYHDELSERLASLGKDVLSW